MNREDRRVWMNAAYRALGHLPADILARAARTAMQTADHPSKIVPGIIAAAEPDLARERSIQRMTSGAGVALPRPGRERPTAAELDAICKQHRVGRYATDHDARARHGERIGDLDPNRPCRAPTRADYIRMGVDPAVLDAEA